MKSPITNRYDPLALRPRLEVEQVVLFEPQSEVRAYAHHPFLAHFQGRFYAMWSNGCGKGEDEPGQRVLLSSSGDFHHWSEPRPLIDSALGKHSPLVLTPAGFHQHEPSLTAYFGQYEFSRESVDGGTYKQLQGSTITDTVLRAVTTTDGHRWSEPLSLSVPIVPNHGPQPTASGRLIISGNVMFPFTDNPSGLSDWQAAGIYPTDMPDMRDNTEYYRVVRERMGWPVGLCEGSFYQTSDGIIHMLLRSGTSRLWVTESADDGRTWSAPMETDFTDNSAKFHCGRLPDGRYYCVGCPDPLPPKSRNPLVLSISEDGVRFGLHYILADFPYPERFAASGKRGDYGYPHTLIHEGYIYVIYSIRKTGIAVLRAALRQL